MESLCLHSMYTMFRALRFVDRAKVNEFGFQFDFVGSTRFAFRNVVAIYGSK